MLHKQSDRTAPQVIWSGNLILIFASNTCYYQHQRNSLLVSKQIRFMCH